MIKLGYLYFVVDFLWRGAPVSRQRESSEVNVPVRPKPSIRWHIGPSDKGSREGANRAPVKSGLLD